MAEQPIFRGAATNMERIQPGSQVPTVRRSLTVKAVTTQTLRRPSEPTKEDE